MEKEINNILFITTKDGQQLTFKVLFTYHSDRFNKDYAAFYNQDDENHLLVFSYDENKTLSEVQTQEEYDELEDVLHKFDEEQSNKKN